MQTQQSGTTKTNSVSPASVVAQAPSIQPKLEIGAVNDPLEYEADSMADKVMRMGGLPPVNHAAGNAIQRCSCGDEEIHRKPLSSFIQRKESAGGIHASAGVSDQINSTRGNGNSMDATTQSFMESRFGTAFNGVKIHTNDEAIQMNRELSARAFTIGNDIYFNEGQYQPGSDSGKHLLAHELTHTVQQNKMINRKLIQRACTPPIVCTWGGEWSTTKYDKMKDKNRNGPTAPALGVRGADIELNFKPGSGVDAELIGLVQTAKAINNNAITYIGDATRQSHGIKAADAIEINKVTKETDEGTHVDQFGPFENPLYATGAASPTDALGDTATNASWGQHGWNYTDAAKAPQHEDAILKDTPTQSHVEKNSSNVFEVAALALKGNQSGTYYGSVQWGWKTDSAGHLDLIPVKPVSQGVPSSSFMKAADIWNAGKTSTGTDTINLPGKDVQVTTRTISDMNAPKGSPLTSSGFQISAGTRVEIIFWGASQKDGSIDYPRIRVADGLFTGRILSITQADLMSLSDERP